MKRNYGTILFVLWALLTLSCENPPVADSSPNRNVAVNDRPAATKPVQNAGGSANPSGGNNPNSPAETPEPADFEGTAGITDKQNKISRTAILEDVHVGTHQGFDRVVFEFEDAELPSYRIEYVDKPVRACGSGNVVPLAGEGWLEIRFAPAAAHSEDGRPTIANRAQKPALKIIREMNSTCDFEAEVEWVLGVAAPNKYRVLELKNPTRLAIDIKH